LVAGLEQDPFLIGAQSSVASLSRGWLRIFMTGL
jgi:hypothetical protein